MKATGITAEYDPLHNGHVFMMEQARQAGGCDALVIAMSGDFVQRGGPALLDKWTRCSLALEAGADLVTEIPVQFCLGNAAQYASASVCMLEALGCCDIAFGSESGDIGLIRKVADTLRKESGRIDGQISMLIKDGLSYPAAREQAYRSVRHGTPEAELEREIAVLSDPNDILALEYVMSMRSSEPLCIKRTGAGHGMPADPSARFQSAGTIRSALSGGAGPEAVRGSVPDQTYEALSREKLSFTDDWSMLLRYAAMSSSPGMIEDCPSAGEGLGNLIMRSARENGSWDSVVKGAKSRRYTYTRISRLCMQLILGIRRRDLTAARPAYIRVLGFSEKGRELLSELKRGDGCGLPLITNVNKEAHLLGPDARAMLELDIRAAEIYDLVTGRGTAHSDHVMMPVIK